MKNFKRTIKIIKAIRGLLITAGLVFLGYIINLKDQQINLKDQETESLKARLTLLEESQPDLVVDRYRGLKQLHEYEVEELKATEDSLKRYIEGKPIHIDTNRVYITLNMYRFLVEETYKNKLREELICDLEDIIYSNDKHIESLYLYINEIKNIISKKDKLTKNVLFSNQEKLDKRIKI